jgi:oxalate---CoA ligase
MLSGGKKVKSVSSCFYQLAREGRPSVAIAVPDGGGITFAEVVAESEICGRMLDDLGVRRSDRVGILIANSPVTITTFIGVISRATAAPLNPAYSAEEFEFYLSDLDVKVLMIDAALDSPARRIANDRGVPVIDVRSADVGSSILVKPSGLRRGRSLVPGYFESGDIALVLNTSGTTSRPKIVPLTHANILASAKNIIRTLSLTPSDRCLTLMPLFHIHGIMVTLSALLSAGQVCAMGFDPQRFFAIFDAFQPTWYSAVPTMHQAILRTVPSHNDAVERSRLRFIRSSSAALPVRVKAELEKVFNAPVIEAYGMTEAAHQMASNPLPPKERKPGSVGTAAGPDIAIMDEQGKLLSAGQTGEIVIRGAGVFQGYETNQNVSPEAFTDGWFRTGDLGYLDADGYLFITGRCKDIINRGGEKVSPVEVDEILLNHPAIEQAITFPVPHPTLGEDVAAAVVLRQGALVSQQEIRDYVAERASVFKVPQRVLVIAEIPKSPTGKIQRRSVAQRLGLVDSSGTKLEIESTYVAPVEILENRLVALWEELISVRPIGIHDNFFEVGGDSLLAVQMMLRVELLVGKPIPMAVLFAAPTVSQLSQAICSDRFGEASSLLIPLNSSGTRSPLFFLHGDIMGGGFFSLNLFQTLGPNRPMYVLSPGGMHANLA